MLLYRRAHFLWLSIVFLNAAWHFLSCWIVSSITLDISALCILCFKIDADSEVEFQCFFTAVYQNCHYFYVLYTVYTCSFIGAYLSFILNMKCLLFMCDIHGLIEYREQLWRNVFLTFFQVTEFSILYL